MALFDPFGREIEKPPSKPNFDMVGAVRVRDTLSGYPSVKLTPERLATIFREADAGDISRQAELAEEMEEKDPELFGAIQTAKLGVQCLDHEILPFSDSAEDKKIADHVKENLQDLDLEDAVLDLMDAIFKGSSFLEINWQMDGRRVWAAGLEWIPQKRWSFVGELGNLSAKIPKFPRLLTDDSPVDGIEVEPFKVIYHRYKARSGFPQRAGLMRTVAFYYLFKNYGIKDWVIFLEKFGQPMRIGKFTPGASSDDLKVLKEALQNLGVDAAAMISDTTLLEILETKTGAFSSDLYERILNFFKRAYEIAILGQTATTEGTPGKLGSEEARSKVRFDLNKARARSLSKTLRDQFIWPMVGFNFGWDKNLPSSRFIIDEPQDSDALADTFLTMVDMGMRVPESFAHKKFGVPMPVGDEPILVRSVRGQADVVEDEARRTERAKKKIPIGSRLVSFR